MAFTHVGTKYIKRQQDFDNFLKFRHTLMSRLGYIQNHDPSQNKRLHHQLLMATSVI